MITSWLRRLTRRPAQPLTSGRRQAARLRLGRLEDRVTPATHIWQGPAAGGVWSSAANWGGGVPTIGEAGGTIVQFNGGIDSTDDIAGLVIDELHFTAGGTTVRGAAGITLGISGLAVTNNLVNDAGTNAVDATLPLNLTGTTVFALVTGGRLTLGSGIGGNQSMDLIAGSAGTLEYAGAAANTYAGATFVDAGTLELNKTAGVTAVPGTLIVGDNVGTDTVRLLAANQIADGSQVSVTSTGFLDLNGNGDTVGSLFLAAGGSVATGAGTLTVTGSAAVTGSSADDALVILTGAPFTATLNGIAIGSIQANGGVSFNGIGGTDTLTGPNVNTTWNITASNAGNVGGAGVINFTNVENLTGGTGADNFVFANAQGVTGTVNGGAGADTLDYGAYTSVVSVNLGINTSSLVAGLDGDQETGPTSSTATATATLTYNNVAHTFDVNMTVTGITLAQVTGFHLHRSQTGVAGPIIVDLAAAGGATFTPTANGFTYTATGVPLQALHEAALLGGLTYLNVHTTAFPGGEIRGQVFPGAAFTAAAGTATGTGGVSNVENATGGSGGSVNGNFIFGDSLVGGTGANLLRGGISNDVLVGGPGADNLQGEADNDFLVWSNGDGSDVMDGGSGNDVVNVNGNVTAADTFSVAAGAGGRVAFQRLNPGPFTLDVGTTETLLVNGGGGNDIFGLGNLTGIASLTAINLAGYDGNDTFNVHSDAAVTVNIVGHLPRTGPGDTLNLDPQGLAVTDTGTQLTQPGRQPVTYAQVEAVNVVGVVTGSGIDDSLVVTATGPNSGTYSLNGGPAVPFSGLTSFKFDGLGGNDTLQINNPAGGLFAPAGGIIFNGGAGTDTLLNLGGSANSGTSTPAGSDGTGFAGTITHVASEVQTLTVSGAASGTFTLTFNGQTTGALDVASPTLAADIQNALNGLPTIGGVGGSVAVTQSGNVFTVTFGGSLANANQPNITAAGAGGTVVGVSPVTDGVTSQITYTGLTPLTDTVTEATFTLNGTDANEAIGLDDGTAAGDGLTRVTFSDAEAIEFANKTNVVINGGLTAADLGDVITVANTEASTGLATITINTGPAGGGSTAGDNVVINAAAAGVPVAVNGDAGNDTVTFAGGVGLNGGIVNGGGGSDTLDYSQYTTAVHANLGIGITAAAALDAVQESPANPSGATGTATFTYNAAAGTFDVNLTVDGIDASDPNLRLDIGQAAFGAAGPVIVTLFDAAGSVNLGTLTPTATGFTFAATGVPLPALSEAAFVGDVTYLNVEDSAFPGGEIRGQVLRQTQTAVATGTATGTGGVIAVENVTGGSGDDSLVGSNVVNVLSGGGGADTMLGGLGGDTFVGGDGDDRMIWSNGDGSDTMDGGVGDDTVQVNGSVGGVGDAFLVRPNPADATRVRFDRTNLGLFNLNIGTTETLTVNGNNADDVFTINNLAGVADLATVEANGGIGNDTFNVQPSPTVTVSVNGGPPTVAPGDTLNVDTTGTTGGAFSAFPTPFGLAGSYTFTGLAPVNFQQIETPSPAGSDLSITKDDGQTTAVPGAAVTYTIVVTNNGPLDQFGVNIADALPTVLQNVAVTAVATGGASGFTANGAGDIFDFAALPAGSTITYTVKGTVDPAAVGTLDNTATVTAPFGQTDPDPSNNTASDSDTLTPQADLAVTKGDSPDPVAAGGVLTYTLTLTNNGPSDATSVSLADVLPAGTTFVSATQTAGPTFTLTTPTVGGGGTVLATLGNFISTNSATFQIIVRVNAATLKGTSIFNTATATATTFDPVSGNDSDSATTTVNSSPLPIVTGAGPGGGAHVKVYDPFTGALKASFFAYANFTGGVRVAAGDVNGDGVPDIVTGAGPGGGPHVKVFDGVTGAEIKSFFAFDGGFGGGVYVAAGDVNDDGFADVIVGAGPGGGPHVKVFSGLDGSVLDSFFAYGGDFHGGVRVAAGDVDGDGKADIVTGAGPGGGPHVKVFSGVNLAELDSFFAFDAKFSAGVFVAAGDLDGDGHADVIASTGNGAPPHVKVFDGVTATTRFDFNAYDAAFPGGVTVSVADHDGDGRLDIITGAGPGGGPHVKAFDGVTLTELASFFAYDPAFLGGVFVG